MKVLLIRHAVAEDRAGYKGDDAIRPLTPEGRRKMRKAAAGLRKIFPDIGVLVSSPLLRAAQTAAIVAKEYHLAETLEFAGLCPEKPPSELLRWLKRHPADAAAFVGHEPHLSHAAGYLLTGAGRSFIELKKGGACLLEFQEGVEAGRAVLRWSLAPSQLRRLAGGG
ncbi:MAG: hypothetical protein A3G41_05425 [Elusimicrobia bacterium RIFCSPLOWO2_12_FULL_59_9]|nr:MAG: hypothetical protein A3G41_05425 [Elusimicrobia bacterium RIFCSPLOWO2_12_FULL_59_9]